MYILEAYGEVNKLANQLCNMTLANVNNFENNI